MRGFRYVDRWWRTLAPTAVASADPCLAVGGGGGPAAGGPGGPRGVSVFLFVDRGGQPLAPSGVSWRDHFLLSPPPPPPRRARHSHTCTQEQGDTASSTPLLMLPTMGAKKWEHKHKHLSLSTLLQLAVLPLAADHLHDAVQPDLHHPCLHFLPGHQELQALYVLAQGRCSVKSSPKTSVTASCAHFSPRFSYCFCVQATQVGRNTRTSSLPAVAALHARIHVCL